MISEWPAVDVSGSVASRSAPSNQVGREDSRTARRKKLKRAQARCPEARPPAGESSEIAQLIAALAGTLVEARARKCGQAVLVVHEFLSQPDPAHATCGTNDSNVARNTADWRAFCLSGSERMRNDEVTGHRSDVDPSIHKGLR